MIIKNIFIAVQVGEKQPVLRIENAISGYAIIPVFRASDKIKGTCK